MPGYQPDDPAGAGVASFLRSFGGTLADRLKQNQANQAKMAFDQWHENVKTTGQKDVAHTKGEETRHTNAVKPVNPASTAKVADDYFKRIAKMVQDASGSRKSFVAQGLKADKYGMIQPNTPEFTQAVHDLSDQWEQDPNNAGDSWILKNQKSIQAAIGRNDRNSLNNLFSQMPKGSANPAPQSTGPAPQPPTQAPAVPVPNTPAPGAPAALPFTSR